MTQQPPLPAACAVAFKEWAGVCDALQAGVQSLLLRKGGIDEPGGFRPEHPAFWLFPTHTHESGAADRPALVGLTALAHVRHSVWLSDLRVVHKLSDYHIWTPEDIAKKFHYKRPGLWALLARVYRASVPKVIENRAEFAGCRTWVELPEPLSTEGLSPVLGEDQFQTLSSQFVEQFRDEFGERG